ncbi:hypothetical protein BGZ63DRAFT_49454 [Mariannaea sp. PMI_226]|nr:hypothetical protein BGZ63DRAFT_49454 [Mariannaea sp. PMI_226]
MLILPLAMTRSSTRVNDGAGRVLCIFLLILGEAGVIVSLKKSLGYHFFSFNCNRIHIENGAVFLYRRLPEAPKPLASSRLDLEEATHFWSCVRSCIRYKLPCRLPSRLSFRFPRSNIALKAL